MNNEKDRTPQRAIPAENLQEMKRICRVFFAFSVSNDKAPLGERCGVCQARPRSRGVNPSLPRSTGKAGTER